MVLHVNVYTCGLCDCLQFCKHEIEIMDFDSHLNLRAYRIRKLFVFSGESRC